MRTSIFRVEKTIPRPEFGPTSFGSKGFHICNYLYFTIYTKNTRLKNGSKVWCYENYAWCLTDHWSLDLGSEGGARPVNRLLIYYKGNFFTTSKAPFFMWWQHRTSKAPFFMWWTQRLRRWSLLDTCFRICDTCASLNGMLTSILVGDSQAYVSCQERGSQYILEFISKHLY